MAVYSEPIKWAIIIFPFLAFFISGALLIYEYRKYGSFVWTRAMILYSFVFYLLCAYFLVILPLPSRAEVAQYTGPTMELRPFHFISGILNETVFSLKDPSTYLPALKQHAVLEPLFNVLLVLPFGVYLRYYFKCSFLKTVLASFLLSLFFELTQLSGLYFIYPRSYRLADVNDLINNTVGGMVGYWLTPLFTFLLPTREEIDATSYEKGQTVSLLRRFFAWGIDWLVIGFVQGLRVFGLNFIPAYKNWATNYPIFSDRMWLFIMVFAVFIVMMKLTNGQTLGKKVVRIRVVETGHEKIRLKALFVRYGYLYFVYGLISIYLANATDLLNSSNRMLQMVSLLLYLFCLILYLLFLINVLLTLIRKKRRLFYEKASHTYTVSTLEVAKTKESAGE